MSRIRRKIVFLYIISLVRMGKLNCRPGLEDSQLRRLTAIPENSAHHGNALEWPVRNPYAGIGLIADGCLSYRPIESMIANLL